MMSCAQVCDSDGRDRATAGRQDVRVLEPDLVHHDESTGPAKKCDFETRLKLTFRQLMVWWFLSNQYYDNCIYKCNTGDVHSKLNSFITLYIQASQTLHN
jgi:hypothetical protein